ncbi:MAG TPA: hypothetical protein VKB96_08225 [Gammaproteobacteria bacterium]|nr:hypothetical protein [Gammaproteobacteria bacterium]
MAKGRKNCGFCLGNTNPSITAWLDLVAKSSEIGLDSGQTIMHRMLIMSCADFSALTADERRAFTRMDMEKLQAAMQYDQLMASEMMRLNQQIAMAT